MARLLAGEALGRLHEGDAEILACYFLEDLSAREIAARLGISEGAVWTRVHRAPRRARAGLGVGGDTGAKGGSGGPV